MPSTAEPCAMMLESAIMGHNIVPPKSAISCISMALDVMVQAGDDQQGIPQKPKMAPNTTRKEPEMPA